MRCLIEGHRPRLFDGYAEFAGSKYWVCVDCGRTEPYQPDTSPMMVEAPQPLLSERREVRN